jgi:hypothetical protein
MTIATFSEIPLRIIFLTPVRRRSWNSKPLYSLSPPHERHFFPIAVTASPHSLHAHLPTPAATQAFHQAPLKSLTGSPSSLVKMKSSGPFPATHARISWKMVSSIGGVCLGISFFGFSRLKQNRASDRIELPHSEAPISRLLASRSSTRIQTLHAGSRLRHRRFLPQLVFQELVGKIAAREA